jgi:ABC-type transporter Mla MlaB component
MNDLRSTLAAKMEVLVRKSGEMQQSHAQVQFLHLGQGSRLIACQHRSNSSLAPRLHFSSRLGGIDRKHMNLHIEQRGRDGITIRDLNGSLTLGHGDPGLRDRLVVLHQSGTDKIALNLREVTEIDSSGLATPDALTYWTASSRMKGEGRVPSSRVALARL